MITLGEISEYGSQFIREDGRLIRRNHSGTSCVIKFNPETRHFLAVCPGKYNWVSGGSTERHFISPDDPVAKAILSMSKKI